MHRKEDLLGSLRIETIGETFSGSEKGAVGNLTEALAASYCDGLRGVDFAVLPAGDLADFLNNHRGKPERIDLRIVPDAPSGSTIRELFVGRLEQFVRGHLDEANLPYIQKSGIRWHSVLQSYCGDSTDLIQVDSDDAHGVCFEVDGDSVLKRRPIGIVISNVRDRALEDQLKWEKEYRQRTQMILLDSRSIRQRIKF